MRIIRSLLPMAIIMVGVALGTTVVQARTLDWVTYKAKGAADAQARTTQWFADELERRTDGEYKIRIHWGGSVAKIDEIPTALRDGLGDMGDVVTPYFPDMLPVNNAISHFIPQPNSSIELGLLMEYWHDTHPQFGEELASHNLKLIGLRPLESYGMICRQPIREMDDFKGKRIRAYGFALPALISALGATPVSMSTPETYEALERGILDCSPVGPNLAHGWRYDEVAKYFVDVPLGASWGHLIAMNREVFNELPEELRQTLESIGREYLVRYANALIETTNEVYETWESDGVEVIKFPREEFLSKVLAHSEVQEVRKEWIDKVGNTGLPADRIVDTLRFE